MVTQPYSPPELPMSQQASSTKMIAATLAFFVAFLLVGLLVFRDYGISWDEFPTRQFGIMYVEHLVPDAAAVDSVRAVNGPGYERFGPIFEILLVHAEKLMGRADLRSIFFMRHLVNFLGFFLGVVLFHRLCRRRFGGGISLLACICLVLSPQLFSHAFYNVKDISFLTMFIAAMLTLDTVLARPAWRSMLLHVVTTTVLLGTRVLGVFAMVLTGAAALAKRPAWRTVGFLLAYGAGVTLLLPLVWPVLRIEFVSILRDAVLGTTSNPYLGTNLFRGRIISASALPWDYLPTWILITTPLVVSGLFIVGAVSSVMRIVRRPRDAIRDSRLELVVLCWFFLPVMGCVVLRPIMYDGWRHLFFVYPAMVFIAAIGMESVMAFVTARVRANRRKAVPPALTTALVLSLAPVLAFMIRTHPLEHLYFNRFAGRDMAEIKTRYELDYWGLSYRTALEFIVRTDPAPRIRLFVTTFPGRANIAMLLPRDRARLALVRTPEEADYLVTHYRFHPEPYPFPWEVFNIRVGNASIISVFASNERHATLRLPISTDATRP